MLAGITTGSPNAQYSPFFIGVQYHPELKSTVEKPAPLFVSFIAAARKYNEQKGTGQRKPVAVS